MTLALKNFDLNNVFIWIYKKFTEVQDNQNSYQIRVKLLRVEARVLSLAMFLMLFASAYQLAIAFGKNHGLGFFPLLKAIGIEICIGVFARMLGRAAGLQQSTWLLWTILVGAMIVSTLANMLYEWRVILAEHGFKNVTLMILKHGLDPLAHIEAFFGSGFLPLMILGLAKAQQIIMVSADLYEKAEIKRAREEEVYQEKLAWQREYNRSRRARLKRSARGGGRRKPKKRLSTRRGR